MIGRVIALDGRLPQMSAFENGHSTGYDAKRCPRNLIPKCNQPAAMAPVESMDVGGTLCFAPTSAPRRASFCPGRQHKDASHCCSLTGDQQVDAGHALIGVESNACMIAPARYLFLSIRQQASRKIRRSCSPSISGASRRARASRSPPPCAARRTRCPATGPMRLASSVSSRRKCAASTLPAGWVISTGA
jgi:hypothetical protein